jgi:peptide chain release factor 2
MSLQPGLWNDPKKAEELLKSIALLRSWITDFEKINTSIDDLVVINDFFREGEATEAEVDSQYKNCLSLIEDVEVRNCCRKRKISLEQF